MFRRRRIISRGANFNPFPSVYEEFIYKSRYARWLDKEARRENWDESITRLVDYYDNQVRKYGLTNGLGDTKQRLFDSIYEMRVMPSMRALMTAGPALDRDHTASFNCAYLTVDSPRAFDEAMFILLCGTGVGYSVEKKYIDKLPKIAEQFEETDTTIVVADSKEGWAKSLRELISLLIAGRIPSWDMSKVRPKGSRLKTFGGRASGPEPLEELFRFTVATFKNAVGRRLTSLECHDLMCKVADVVIVGGVRRSAMISLSDVTDDRMRYAKSGAWWEQTPHRALANNSAVYEHRRPEMQLFFSEWKSLYDSKSGERGIFSRYACENIVKRNGRRDVEHDFGCNPCCVAPETLILTKEGNVPIADTVGRTTTIWNGEAWADVVPYEAGVADLFRVTLSDGNYLDCTSNHRWVLKGGDFVETKDLLKGDELEKFPIPGNLKQVDNILVVSVESLQRVDMTYCFTEPKTSRGTFNGIVTGNSEIILRPFQMCNLSEIVVRVEDTADTLMDKAEVAAILGTIQSTLTDFKYLRKVWKNNCDEERLLGVSLTGVCDNLPLLESPEFLQKLKQRVIDTNIEWAEKLGISPSVATTTIKPSGTVSQLVNSSSGLHARYAPYYLRTVRADLKDPIAQFLKDVGVYNEPEIGKETTGVVFYFPVKAPEHAVTRHNQTALEALELWKHLQDNWCEHKPSATVSVKEDEWLEVGAWVYRHFDSVSGISFLPYDGGSYKQAPYQELSEQEWREWVDKHPTPEIDWDDLRLYEQEDNTSGSQELACTAGSCEVVNLGV